MYPRGWQCPQLMNFAHYDGDLRLQHLDLLPKAETTPSRTD
jgi:hypothetical protein